MPAFSPFLALRYLYKRRINLLGVFGVSFAVWAMIVVNSVFTGFVAEIRSDVRNSAPDMLVTDLPHDTSYEKLRTVIAADPGVLHTAPRLRHHGMFQPLRVPSGGDPMVASSEVEFDHTENGFALLLGVDPLLEENVTGLRGWLQGAPAEFAAHFRDYRPEPSPVLDEKDPLRRARLTLPDEIEWEARVNANLPRDRNVADFRSTWPGLLLGWRRIRSTGFLHVGEPLDLICAGFRPDAGQGAQLRPHSMRLAFAGWFATGYRMFDMTTAILPIETLRTLLGHDLANPQSIDLVTDVAIAVRPELPVAEWPAMKRRLQVAVQAALGPGSAPCSVLDWEEQNSVFLSAVAHEQAMMQFVLFVVMLVAAFVIYATLHMMVVQKVKDIGIMAAIGGTPRGIGAVFLLGGFVVAALGAALGTVLGALSVHWLNPFNQWLYETTSLELFPRALFDLPEIPCRLEAAWIVQVVLGAMLLALVVAFVPSRKAARMNPVNALSYE